MYPYQIFLGIDLYTLFLCIGILSALVIFRIFSDRAKMYWKLQNFCVIVGTLAITAGVGSAVLFQAFYNFLDDPQSGFSISRSTGSTFFGGLIGGVVGFLLIYFVVGSFLFKKNKEHIREFFNISNIAAASISAAHGFGRLGCLMAGCCHGAVTDAWYGVYFVNYEIKAVPIQLFEAIFLFSLFGLFLFRLIKGKKYNLPLYMILYGIWRFVIEFFRADDRGATIVSFLSPSQLIALLMICGSVGVFFLEKYVRSKWKADGEVLENVTQESFDDKSADEKVDGNEHEN